MSEQNVSSRFYWQCAWIFLALGLLNLGITSTIAGVIWVVGWALGLIMWWLER